MKKNKFLGSIVLLSSVFMLGTVTSNAENTEKQELNSNAAEVVSEVKPEEVKPEEVKPEEVKPEEVKPEEVKPEEVKPEEVKPEEVKPEEVKPEEVKPEEVKPEEVKPEEVNSNEDLDKQKKELDATIQGFVDENLATADEYAAVMELINNAKTITEIDIIFTNFYDTVVVPKQTEVEDYFKVYEDEIASWVEQGKINSQIEVVYLTLLNSAQTLEEYDQIMNILRSIVEEKEAKPELSEQIASVDATAFSWMVDGLISYEDYLFFMTYISTLDSVESIDEAFTDFYDENIVPQYQVIEEIIKEYEDEIASWVKPGYLTPEDELMWLGYLNSAESLEEMEAILNEFREYVASIKPKELDPTVPVKPVAPVKPILPVAERKAEVKTTLLTSKVNPKRKETLKAEGILPATGEQDSMIAMISGLLMLALFGKIYYKKETEI